VTAWIGAFLAAVVYFLELTVLPIDPWIARVLQDSITAGFIAWILVVVLREVFRPATSEGNAVVGALAGFLLILSVFTRLHGLAEALSPGAYHADGGPFAERGIADVVATFQYFSTVTLTTVGFGDIVPVTRFARLLTGFEAIVGQFYVAVVIAALVGRAAAGRAAGRAD
jgi:voltage-gated potassium channel Kch